MSAKKNLRDVGRKHAARQRQAHEVRRVAEREALRIDLGAMIEASEEPRIEGLRIREPDAVIEGLRFVRQGDEPRLDIQRAIGLGFCGGAFGRDSYGPRDLIAAGFHRGTLWIVAEERIDGSIVMASGVTLDAIAAWIAEQDEEDADDQ